MLKAIPKNNNDRKKELKEIISSRIKGELDKKGWKKHNLVEIINKKLQGQFEFSPATIYGFCDGATLSAPDCLAAIANALEVSTDYLLGITDTSIRLNPEDANFGNNIFAFIEWFNSAVGESRKITIILGDRTNESRNTDVSTKYSVSKNQGVNEFILEDANRLMMFPSSKGKDKICHKSHFVVVNGNIYPEAIYENQDFGVSEHTSYYDLVNSVSKGDNLFGLKYLRELHSAYRRDRYLYGGLGRLTDIDFFLLNYMMGYFYKNTGVTA